MTAEIVPLHPGAVGEGYKVQADDVLEAAKGRLLAVTVVGFTEDGKLYVAGSDGAETSYFLMARAQQFLLDFDVERA